jgi:hypothetical protein
MEQTSLYIGSRLKAREQDVLEQIQRAAGALITDAEQVQRAPKDYQALASMERRLRQIIRL